MKIHRTPKAAVAEFAIGSMLFAACSAEESSNPSNTVSVPDTSVETGLPPAGMAELPAPWPGAQTYYVVAENAAGRTVMEATR